MGTCCCTERGPHTRQCLRSRCTHPRVTFGYASRHPRSLLTFHLPIPLLMRVVPHTQGYMPYTPPNRRRYAAWLPTAMRARDAWCLPIGRWLPVLPHGKAPSFFFHTPPCSLFFFFFFFLFFFFRAHVALFPHIWACKPIHMSMSMHVSMPAGPFGIASLEPHTRPRCIHVQHDPVPSIPSLSLYSIFFALLLASYLTCHVTNRLFFPCSFSQNAKEHLVAEGG